MTDERNVQELQRIISGMKGSKKKFGGGFIIIASDEQEYSPSTKEIYSVMNDSKKSDFNVEQKELFQEVKMSILEERLKQDGSYLEQATKTNRVLLVFDNGDNAKPYSHQEIEDAIGNVKEDLRKKKNISGVDNPELMDKMNKMDNVAARLEIIEKAQEVGESMDLSGDKTENTPNKPDDFQSRAIKSNQQGWQH